jgi:hypothetical protein
VQDAVQVAADRAPPVVLRSASGAALDAPSRLQPFAHHNQMTLPAIPFGFFFLN